MGRYYFAYGSCMDLEGRIKREGYIGEFRPVGTGKVDGYCFRMNKRAVDGVNVYANIQPEDGSSVYGKLYRITETVEKNYLDLREGYPNHYEKEYVKVTVGKKVYENVLVYVATQKYVTNQLLPTTPKYENELKKGGEFLPIPYRLQFLAEIDRCAEARTNTKLGGM